MGWLLYWSIVLSVLVGLALGVVSFEPKHPYARPHMKFCHMTIERAARCVSKEKYDQCDRWQHQAAQCKRDRTW